MLDLTFILAQAATLPATTRAVAQAVGNSPPSSVDPLFAFYAANLRGSLFSGFLTLGSFLVAINTFIVVNLKKELYDHDGYRNEVLNRRRLNQANRSKKDVSYYGPLQRLSTYLFWAILLALGTAVAQLTLGLYASRWSAIICLLLACATLANLILVLITIKANLVRWFGFLEAATVKKMEPNDASASETKKS